MNPRVPAEPAELARWLLNFATAHARREDPRIEVELDTGGKGGEEERFTLRLRLGAELWPPGDASPLVLTAREVAAGRGRFAWCEDLARQLRDGARQLGTSRRPAA